MTARASDPDGRTGPPPNDRDERHELDDDEPVARGPGELGVERSPGERVHAAVDGGCEQRMDEPHLEVLFHDEHLPLLCDRDQRRNVCAGMAASITPSGAEPSPDIVPRSGRSSAGAASRRWSIALWSGSDRRTPKDRAGSAARRASSIA
ncbi:MAG TPA: hypothetical protein VFP41_08960 [Actinomycetota bacterium]|nr:hypothetical protein [Actinomycetota bacterium]